MSDFIIRTAAASGFGRSIAKRLTFAGAIDTARNYTREHGKEAVVYIRQQTGFNDFEEHEVYRADLASLTERPDYVTASRTIKAMGGGR